MCRVSYEFISFPSYDGRFICHPFVSFKGLSVTAAPEAKAVTYICYSFAPRSEKPATLDQPNYYVHFNESPAENGVSVVL